MIGIREKECTSIVIQIVTTLILASVLISSFSFKTIGNISSLEFEESTTPLSLNFSFPFPKVKEYPSQDSIMMAGLQRYGAPGEPVLPFKIVKALIPHGKDLQSIDVTTTSRVFLEGSFSVEYGKTLSPISSDVNIEEMQNQRIYGSANPFPGVLFSQAAVQYLRGYRILMLKFHPVQYIPQNGTLFYYETMTLTMRLKKTREASSFLRILPQDRKLVLDVIDNPSQLNTYPAVTNSQHVNFLNHHYTYNYIIITSSALSSSFQPLIDWKIQKGLNAMIVLLENIVNNSDYHCDGLYGDGCGSPKFNDTQAHIRNFIKDAYQNWDTEYVLLGGDVEIIPARGVCAYVQDIIDYSIPCDMYYGALDGSWNNDNDTKFGEGVIREGDPPQCSGTAGEEADFFAEVYIGRAPVETLEEATCFVDKTLWYEQTSDDNYFKKALMVGETLDRDTEGGNSKDLVTNIIPQYTTTRLYDRDGTFTHNAVIAELNSGVHIVNHYGHANQRTVMGLSKSAIDNLSNEEYFIIYSTGCYSAAFDLDIGQTEAIAENFILSSRGAFAYIGNTRYGWYMPGTTTGPGDLFDQEFFIMLKQGNRALGKALQLSKESLFGRFFHRWTCFTLVLLGDPETEITTEIAAPMAHFKPATNMLEPQVVQGCVKIRGTARRGTASDATLSNFTIEFGWGTNPTSWIATGMNLTDRGTEEIENNVLGKWDTSLVIPFNTYTLKLTVLDDDCRVGEDRWIVRVEPIPTIHLNLQPTEIRVGQTLTVEAQVTNVHNLYGLDVRFSWNTTFLDYVSYTVTIPIENHPNGILHEPVKTINEDLNHTRGMFMIQMKSEYPALPFKGDGTIFTMTFEAMAVGTCTFNFTSSRLLDKNAQPIDHTADNDTVEIFPGIHDVAVKAITVDKTAVCKGQSVQINITVENKGSFHESFNVTSYANETLINTTEVTMSYYNLMIISIKWNTTQTFLGIYRISATASIVFGENQTTDNTYIGDTVTVRAPIFDIAILSIDIAKTVVGHTYLVSLNVTAQNQGDLVSAFDIIICADINNTVNGDKSIIGTQNLVLEGGHTKTISFTWNTTDFVKGNYTIIALSEPIQGEIDTTDNTLVDGWVVVTVPGDVDGDFDVDIYEIVRICAAYGSELGDLEYEANCDVDGDGDVDIYDVVIACNQYGIQSS